MCKMWSALGAFGAPPTPSAALIEPVRTCLNRGVSLAAAAAGLGATRAVAIPHDARPVRRFHVGLSPVRDRPLTVAAGAPETRLGGAAGPHGADGAGLRLGQQPIGET